MIKIEEFSSKSGDVVMDSTTFADCLDLIHRKIKPSDNDHIQLESLYQVIESLILYERILIEPISYDNHFIEGLNYQIQKLGFADVVEPISIKLEVQQQVRSQAKKLARDAISSIEPEILDILYQFGLSSRRERIHAKKDESYKRNIKLQISQAVIERAYLNLFLSYELALPYIPHTLRSPIMFHELAKVSNYQLYVDTAIRSVKLISEKVIYQRNDLINANIFNFELPMIANSIFAKRPSTWYEVFELTLDARYSKHAISFRLISKDLDKAAQLNDLSKLGNALDDLSELASLWSNHLNQEPLDISIGFPMGVEFNPFNLWNNFSKRKNSRHLIFLRDLVKCQTSSTETFTNITKLEPLSRLK